MDTTQKVSASTITDFFQSEEEKESVVQDEAGRTRRRAQHPRYPRHPEQLYPPPPPPPQGYYPYYPPPLPVAPAIAPSYFYLELIKHLTSQNEYRHYLKSEEDNNKKKVKDSESKVNDWLKNQVNKKECDHPLHNEDPSKHYSRLCESCEHRFRCSCCSKQLGTDMVPQANSCMKNSCCQSTFPLHPFMHFNPKQLLEAFSCNCSCQKQEEVKTKRRPKAKGIKNKCNETCLQSNRNEIPERDNSPRLTTNRGNRTYRKDDAQESCDSENYCQGEIEREEYESDYQSDEEGGFRSFGVEGDEDKMDSRGQKSEMQNNRVRKTRRSLAYFINV